MINEQQLMSDFANGDDKNDADKQQPTLWLDAFHNKDNFKNKDTQQPTLWSDAFNDDGKDNPCFWCNNHL